MAESGEGLWMSAKERDRLKVLHEVKERHITQKQAAAELGLSVRWVRELLLRWRAPRVLYQGTCLWRPSWRKDSSAIAFLEAPDVPEKAEIKLVDPKSGQVNALPGSTGLILPAISHDGRYLGSGTADSRELKLYDFSAQTWQEFARPAGVGFAEWSADSHYIYFDNGLSADSGVYRFRIGDHKVEQVASLKNFRRAVWGNLPWFGLTPNGDPLVLRDVGSQEVYALDFEEP
jgi:hypothetical protein